MIMPVVVMIHYFLSDGDLAIQLLNIVIFNLSSNTLKGDAKLNISVTVKNTGSRAGKHTVELYTRDMYASITPIYETAAGISKNQFECRVKAKR